MKLFCFFFFLKKGQEWCKARVTFIFLKSLLCFTIPHQTRAITESCYTCDIYSFKFVSLKSQQGLFFCVFLLMFSPCVYFKRWTTVINYNQFILKTPRKAFS